MHGPSHKHLSFLVHHCQTVLHHYYLGGLFQCFVFFSLCGFIVSLVSTGFCQLSADLLRFLLFPTVFHQFLSWSSEKFTYFLRALAFVSFPKFAQILRRKWSNFLVVCLIHVWFATGFHVGFKVPSLLLGLLRASDTGSSSAVSAMRLRASVFFFSLSGSVLCKFPLDFAGLHLWISCVCCFCLFPVCLQSSFDCLGFHCGFCKFAVKFSVPSTGPLLGPKIVEIFCQVLEGPPE